MSRKRAFLDDGDSDSVSGSEDDHDPHNVNDDPDERAERELFKNPYGRKRQRRNGKEDAIYGVFGDDSEDEGLSGRSKGRGGAAQAKRSDWAKAPSFVPKQAAGGKEGLDTGEEAKDGEDDSEDASSDAEMEDTGDTEAGEDDEADGDDAEAGESPGESRAPSRGADDDVDMDERPRFGGLGIGASKSHPPTAFSGFARAGIGASRPAAVSASASPAPASPVPVSSAPSPPPQSGDDDMPSTLPSAFGSAARAQRSFVRDETGTSKPPTPAQLSANERAHFGKLKGTFGARMLEKMGWQSGIGLGTSGEGIVTPVESKLRPKNMGIAFRGFTEKTAQSKAEARRRGEVVSDDEDAKPKGARKAKEKAEKKADVWRKPKKVKVKVQHKTYEEIVADAGQEAAGPSGVGVIIDATGATPREISSLADVSTASWTPSTDSTRIPEVRHNIRLIAESATADLKGLAQEANEIQKRRKTIAAEDARLRGRVAEEAELIARMQEVRLVADEIHSLAKQLSSMYEATLEPLSPHVDKLVTQYPREYDRYRLDELVVAAIAPIVRRSMASWNPLEEPELLLDTFRLWRRALKITEQPLKPPETQVGFYGAATVVAAVPPLVETPMTPFESLLWNTWLPRVRSAINNDWDPSDPAPAARVYESWASFLPPFIRDNILDQLILPKLSKAIADWRPSSSISLRALVFPWLPHVGLRIDALMSDAIRRLKSVLRAWLASDPLPADLPAWRSVLPAHEWDALTLKYVLPKLGAALRDDFRVNPRAQDMAPLAGVLAWTDLLRPRTMAQLLAREFFPKWLDVLHVWLVQPRPSFEEVARWMEGWRGVFPDSIRAEPDVQAGFTRALDLVNQAIDLGPRAPTHLPKPDFRSQSAPGSVAQAPTPKKLPSRTPVEVTFRALAEEYAAQHNLLFVPTQRVHERSRMPLIRVSTTADGRGGLLVYVLDDAVWAPDPENPGGDYRAISLENMVLRATGKG